LNIYKEANVEHICKKNKNETQTRSTPFLEGKSLAISNPSNSTPRTGKP
jgi:hypothetical protein